MTDRAAAGAPNTTYSYDPATYGERIADVYDDSPRLPATGERAVEFLAAIAGRGPILELGIGTGRLALPLASRGFAVHGIDASQFNDVTMRKEVYLTWRDLHAWLARTFAQSARVAMEYAPGNTLPVVSMVDAGTVELVRSVGVDVVTSADLIQTCIAVWSEPAQREHAIAQQPAEGGRFHFLQRPGVVTRNAAHVKRLRALGLQYAQPPIAARLQRQHAVEFQRCAHQTRRRQGLAQQMRHRWRILMPP